MKKIAVLILLSSMLTMLASAQIQPGSQMPLPRQDIARPKPVVKSYTLANDLKGRWRGARIIQNVGSVTVDSMWMEFKADGLVYFQHQSYEINGPKEGTYTISRTALGINFEKAPYTHVFTGGMNVANGMITGNFIETRAIDNTQPPYYVPGTYTGSFSLRKY